MVGSIEQSFTLRDLNTIYKTDNFTLIMTYAMKIPANGLYVFVVEVIFTALFEEVTVECGFLSVRPNVTVQVESEYITITINRYACCAMFVIKWK